MKIFSIWAAVASMVVAVSIHRLADVSPLPWRKAVFILLFFSLTASGALALSYEFQSKYLFLSSEQKAFGEWVKKHTSPDAVFLTDDSHLHPVATIAGRQLVMGYRGWLYSYGIDYTQRINDVRDMLSGSQRSEQLLDAYNVDYIVFSRTQSLEFPFNASFFDSHYPIAYRSQGYTVYARR